MQRRYETTTLKPADEKKMLADIKKMKDSIPSANRLLELKPLIDALYDQRKAVNVKLDVVKVEIEKNDSEIEKVKKELEEAKDHRDDIKLQLDKFEDNITNQKELLQKLYTSKDEMREEHFKARFEFEIEADAIRQNEWIIR